MKRLVQIRASKPYKASVIRQSTGKRIRLSPAGRHIKAIVMSAAGSKPVRIHNQFWASERVPITKPRRRLLQLLVKISSFISKEKHDAERTWRVARSWQITNRLFLDPHWAMIFKQVALTGTVCMTRATCCLVQRLESDVVSLWSFQPTGRARTLTPTVHSGTRPSAQFFIGEPERTNSALITQHLNQTDGGGLP